ncbi:hypothetical protein BGZ83_008586 [Gryganskiella cystojenkinii]|nr:hypothetical protein BGZ83_008586 [Gryganskiella cystojenkinii]
MFSEENVEPDSQSTSSLIPEPSEFEATVTTDKNSTKTEALTPSPDDVASPLSAAVLPQKVSTTPVKSESNATNAISGNETQNRTTLPLIESTSPSSFNTAQLSARQRWLTLSKSNAEAAAVARLTRDNTMNNHLVSAPTAAERSEHASSRTVSNQRCPRSNKRSHQEAITPPSTLSTVSSIFSSASSSSVQGTVARSSGLLDEYYADDETEIDRDEEKAGLGSDGEDDSTTGRSLPLSPQFLNRSGGNKRMRLLVGGFETEPDPSCPGSVMQTTSMPTSPSSLKPVGILRHQLPPVRHQSGTIQKTVRFKIPTLEEEDDVLTEIDSDSDSDIEMSSLPLRSKADGPTAGSGISMDSLETDDATASKPSSFPSTWLATAGSSSRPNSSDTKPALPSPFSMSRPFPSWRKTFGTDKDDSDNVERHITIQQQQLDVEMSSPKSKSAFWSPPRLRPSFSDISAASSRVPSHLPPTTPVPPPQPSLEDTLSPASASASAPSSPETPRVPKMRRSATLPMVSKSKAYSDANLLIHYEGLVPSFAAAAKISDSSATGLMATDDSGYVADTSAESVDLDLSLGHEEQGPQSPSRGPSSSSRIFDENARMSSSSLSLTTTKADVANGKATTYHPYRRPAAAAVASTPSRSATPRLVRSASQSPPSASFQRPSLRRTLSSQFLILVSLHYVGTAATPPAYQGLTTAFVRGQEKLNCLPNKESPSSRWSLGLTDEDIKYFQSILTPSGLVQDADDLQHFNNDWMGKFQGQSKLVLKPSSTEHVSKILAYCNKKSISSRIFVGVVLISQWFRATGIVNQD